MKNNSDLWSNLQPDRVKFYSDLQAYHLSLDHFNSIIKLIDYQRRKYAMQYCGM